MLGIVGAGHVLPIADGAARGLEALPDQLHERGLAGTVGADQGDVVPAVEREVDVLVDEVVAVALRDALEAHDGVSRARRRREREAHALVLLGQHDELLADLLDALDALLDLLRLGGLVAEAVDEDFHVRDVALLRGTLGLELLEVVLALLEVGGVVAGVGHEHAVLERRHVGDAGVHERAVVRDDEDGAVVGREELLEPQHALEIEVVGRLVEQQQVGMAQEELGEGDAHLPSAGELRGGLVELGHGESEAAQDGAGARFQLIAAEALEALAGVAVAVEQRVARRLVLLDGDGMLELAEHVSRFPDLVRGIDDFLERALALGDAGFLLEIADGRVAREAHRALVGGLLAHEDLQQRGLPRAVGTDERPAFTRVELQGGAGVEDLGSERFRYLVGKGDQGAAPRDVS